MVTTDDDLELLERWRADDKTAGNQLVRRYDPLLGTFFLYKATRQACEDLKQQVWLELSKSRLREVRVSFRAYLFGIARNVLFHHCKQGQRTLMCDPLITSLADLDPSLSRQLAQELGVRNLRVVLRRLPLEVQLLLESRYLHEMSTAELAAMYDVPAGTIKSRLSHARKLLAAQMPAGVEVLSAIRSQ